MKPSLLAVAFTVLAGTHLWTHAQVGAGNPPVPPSWSQRPNQAPAPNAPNSQPTEDPAERMLREQRGRMGAERLEQAKADAGRLLVLAAELKHEVDASGGATVSAKVNADSDEIGKLAKSVKSKMRPM